MSTSRAAAMTDASTERICATGGIATVSGRPLPRHPSAGHPSEHTTAPQAITVVHVFTREAGVPRLRERG
jgi:hypothetical protein